MATTIAEIEQDGAAEQGKKRRNVDELLNEAISKGAYYDAAYALAAVMGPSQRVEWAVWSAEQVINIFEENYPGDDRPGAAINAAKSYLKNPSVGNAAKTLNAANAAAYAAVYATNATNAAPNAAYAAAAGDAANGGAAAAAGDAARKAMFTKILHKGLAILKQAES